ncbi:MAG TPA: alpha/beta hydrolase [Methylomirabilota bacterium]|nr:alpha/beta hydrolase [Methylomirabilota bacterium]
MPFFPHDGIQFHYRDEGRGLPFVFQHGLGADVSQPFSLCRPPAGVRLIGFDARAHGQTRPVGPEDRISLRGFADDLAALLDYLGINRAIVGGISMGAAITLNFTLRHPGRVLGLVQSRPAWLDAPNPWNVKMFSLITRLVREHGRMAGRQAFLETPEYKEALAKWPDTANALAGQFENPVVEETAFKFERIIRDAPCRDRREWASIKVPTLVLGNRFDPIHPFEYAEEMARLIPRAQFREITSKSVSVEQHNEDVRGALSAFLREQLSGPSAGEAEKDTG